MARYAAACDFDRVDESPGGSGRAAPEVLVERLADIELRCLPKDDGLGGHTLEAGR
jgi:hypothetical protein